LKVDSLLREQMYADSEFQYDAAETEMHERKISSDAGRSGQKI